MYDVSDLYGKEKICNCLNETVYTRPSSATHCWPGRSYIVPFQAVPHSPVAIHIKQLSKIHLRNTFTYMGKEAGLQLRGRSAFFGIWETASFCRWSGYLDKSIVPTMAITPWLNGGCHCALSRPDKGFSTSKCPLWL